MSWVRAVVPVVVAAGALVLFPVGVVRGEVVTSAGFVQTGVGSGPVQADPPTDPIGMDEFGTFPRNRYEISCDEGGMFDGIRKFVCLVQGWPFGISKAITGLSGTVLGWSMGMSLMGTLTEMAASMAEAYNSGIVGPLKLKHVAWTVAIMWCSILMLRRQTSRALGEFAVTVAAAFLGVWLIANPAGYLGGYVTTIEAINTQLVSTVNDGTPATLTRSVRQQMHQSFIAEPYDLLNWGEPLTGDCAGTRNEILESGPHGNDDKPRNMMKDAGCKNAAKFNHDPSFTRFGGGAMLAFGSSLMAILVLMLAAGVQIFQILLLPLWAGMPVVLVLAMMPGGGRRLLGWWLGANLTVGFLYVATSATLIFVTSAIQALLSSQTDMGIMQRMFVIDLVIAAGFKLRKVAISSATTIGRSFGDSLNRAMPANTASGWGSLRASANPLGDMVRDVPGGHYYDRSRYRVRRAGARATRSALGRGQPGEPRRSAGRRARARTTTGS